MTELAKCLLGTSKEPHGDKIAALYRELNRMGNNEVWQLAILDIIRKGIEAKIEEDQHARNCALNQNNARRRFECDNRGF